MAEGWRWKLVTGLPGPWEAAALQAQLGWPPQTSQWQLYSRGGEVEGTCSSSSGHALGHASGHALSELAK